MFTSHCYTHTYIQTHRNTQTHIHCLNSSLCMRRHGCGVRYDSFCLFGHKITLAWNWTGLVGRCQTNLKLVCSANSFGGGGARLCFGVFFRQGDGWPTQNKGGVLSILRLDGYELMDWPMTLEMCTSNIREVCMPLNCERFDTCRCFLCIYLQHVLILVSLTLCMIAGQIL